MRFGIMTMQLEALVPPGIPADQVMANILSFDHAGLAQRLFEQGFNPIELSGDLGMFLPHAYQPEAIEKLKALKSRGLGYTVHLPLWSVEPSTPLTPVRQGSVAGGGGLHPDHPAARARSATCCTPPVRWQPSSTT